MSRTVLAFLIAPLWVPAATAPFAAYMFPPPENHHWIYITTIIGAVFGYGGVLTLGVPAFLILRARKHTAVWIAIVLGFCIGVLTCFIFLVLFGLSLGNSLILVWHDFAAEPAKWSLPFLLTGALGAVVGTTLWLIARPDRECSASQSANSN